jgi:hypothetical protein
MTKGVAWMEHDRVNDLGEEQVCLIILSIL